MMIEKRYTHEEYPGVPEKGKIYISKDKEREHRRVEVLGAEENYWDDETGGGSLISVRYRVLEPRELTNTICSQLLEVFSDEYRTKRTPSCWKCKRGLDETRMERCIKCGWIMCPDDRACGCGRMDSQKD